MRENINVNVVKTEAKQHVECGVVVIKQASGKMQMKVLTKFRLTDFEESNDENADAKQKPEGGGAEQACCSEEEKPSKIERSTQHQEEKKYCAERGSNASCKFVNERKAVA